MLNGGWGLDWKMANEPVPVRIARYRYRAEELRTLIDSLTTDEARDSLLRVAQSYEQIATRLETGSARLADRD